MLSHVKHSLKVILNEKQLSLAKGFIYKTKRIQKIGRLAADEIRVQHLSQFFPMKPETLNFLVNDVCNSRCQMCLIWKNKKDKELSPDELQQILSDGLFSNLKYVGVSGGEPTLRKDLPELFDIICSKTPQILGTGIITNGIIEDVVKKRVIDSAEVCKSHGVKFNLMLSLDGVGEIHDTVRGRKNNFQSTISLLKFFHEQTDIPTSFGCTVTRSNVLYVDELIDYAKAKGLYGRFRVAEFIKRLYNDKQTEYVRAFDDKDLYHLSLFFFRAEHDFEKSTQYQKTYRNIRSMLSEGKPRQISCPYQSKAVVLTSRGELLYCSPKSPILGNTLTSLPSDLYFSNLKKRQEIIKKDCSNCIHDYHVPVSFSDKINSFFRKKSQKKYHFLKLLKISTSLAQRDKFKSIANLDSKKVLIVGWYGTETAGDKAILWTVISKLRSRPNPPQTIYLSSLYPFITSWTVKEMDLGSVSIVETYSKEFESACDEVDEIVVGGGPLMGIKSLDHILYAFIRSAKSQSFARIEGCGIGPLKSSQYTQVISEIFRLSNHTTLRDKASTNLAQQHFSIANIAIVPDPATDYVQHIKSDLALLSGSTPLLGHVKNISCFLRAWSQEYAGDKSRMEYIYFKDKFELELAKLVVYLAQDQNADLHLLPMHTFHVGGDDRVFNRHLSKLITQHIPAINIPSISIAKSPVSPLEILQSMYHAKFNVCMRFHSVLFADTLGVPYIAIDYTSGGKIKAFLEERGKLNKLISLNDIVEGRWQERLINYI